MVSFCSLSEKYAIVSFMLCGCFGVLMDVSILYISYSDILSLHAIIMFRKGSYSLCDHVIMSTSGLYHCYNLHSVCLLM